MDGRFVVVSKQTDEPCYPYVFPSFHLAVTMRFGTMYVPTRAATNRLKLEMGLVPHDS